MVSFCTGGVTVTCTLNRWRGPVDFPLQSNSSLCGLLWQSRHFVCSTDQSVFLQDGLNGETAELHCRFADFRVESCVVVRWRRWSLWCDQYLLSVCGGELWEPLQKACKVTLHHPFCYFTVIEFPIVGVVVPCSIRAIWNLKVKQKREQMSDLIELNESTCIQCICLPKRCYGNDQCSIVRGLKYLPWQNSCTLTDRPWCCSQMILST